MQIEGRRNFIGQVMGAAAAAGRLSSTNSIEKPSTPMSLPSTMEGGDIGELSRSESVPSRRSRTMLVAGNTGARSTTAPRIP